MDLPDDVRELPEGTNYAHVATLLPDGAPQPVPVPVAARRRYLIEPKLSRHFQLPFEAPQ